MLEVGWVLFIAASLILIVTPGQDMMLVMSRSIAQGPAAGIITAAGVSVGLVGHTVLATLGLGAILGTSEWLFLALKLVGAVYLVYLGLQLLRTQTRELAVSGGALPHERCGTARPRHQARVRATALKTARPFTSGTCDRPPTTARRFRCR
jgi:threonine/homoserine/homoserine lactone efflux protein